MKTPAHLTGGNPRLRHGAPVTTGDLMSPSGRGALRSVLRAGVVTLALAITTDSAVAEGCARERTLYVPVDTADEALGLRGETRAQYLDRIYGEGRWGTDGDARLVIVAPAADNEPIRVRFAGNPRTRLQQIDLVIEARVDYIDTGNRRSIIYGHRLLASYSIDPGAIPTLSVPQSVFKEAGALLVVARFAHPAGAGERPIRVEELPISTADCGRVYVKDRFTAIRLNRAQDARQPR